MIQCVGPVCTVRPTDEGAALLLPRFQPEPKMQAPERSIAMVAPAPGGMPATVPEAQPAPTPIRAAKGRVEAQPIGIAIGKPVRKRSLLGRMFGR